MEEVIFSWATGQAWFGVASTVVVVANMITMSLKDEYAEKLPILGKIWPILNWLSLNVAKNKNQPK
tara:strand:- start:134 stop:331 length:198 start_codon:yes stop_codon:yes gene_type:complete